MLLFRKEGLLSTMSLSMLSCLSTLLVAEEKLHGCVTESFCSLRATCILVRAKAPLF